MLSIKFLKEKVYKIVYKGKTNKQAKDIFNEAINLKFS